jgi:NitT/TauT family transport system substrate-binding protein
LSADNSHIRNEERTMRLTRRGILKATIASGVALAAPTVIAAPALRPIRFALNIVPNGTNSPFYLALQRGYFRDAGFDVALDAGNGTDAINRLVSGTHPAGFVDIGALIEFVGRRPTGAPVGVFNIYGHSPDAIITWKESKVKTPADLVGKSLAAPSTDAPTRLFPVFAKLNNIDPASVSLKTVSMQLREAIIKDRTVDGAFGFDATVLPNMLLLGFDPSHFDIMYYADYHFDLYSNTVIMTPAFIAEDRKGATALLTAISRGWLDAIKDPAAANAALVAAEPLTKSDLELMRLKWVLDKHVVTAEAKENGLGGVVPKRMANAIDLIVQGFDLPSKPAPDAIFDGSMLPDKSLRSI